jgi:ABC-type polysaccharide/polyol phosphate export permease
MKTAFLFIKKDFWEESSYKFSFFMKIFKIFFTISILFYFSNFIEKKGYYNGKTSLFQYLFIGHLFYEFLISNLKKSSSKIMMEQYKGTLELLFNTSSSPYLLMFYMNLYNSIFSYFLVNIYIILGVFFFDLSLNLTVLSYLQFNLAILLVYFYLFFWGMIGASITLIIKKTDPITSALIYFFTFAGSLYFPANILPNWINFFNIFFPISKSVNLIRDILYKNVFNTNDFYLLIVHFIVIFVVSLTMFNFSIKISKKYNSLSTY